MTEATAALFLGGWVVAMALLAAQGLLLLTRKR
jgi:hypothetical protein